jgi:hypothetical protein
VPYARAGLGAQGAAWLAAAHRGLPGPSNRTVAPPTHKPITNTDSSVTTGAAAHIYADWLHRLRILPRFPQPDGGLADQWIAQDCWAAGCRHHQPPPFCAPAVRFSAPTLSTGALSQPHLARAVSEFEAAAFPGARLASGLVIAPCRGRCVQSSCYPRCWLQLQRALEPHRRTLIQCRVQALFLITLLQELAHGCAGVGEIPIFGSVYL